MKPFDQFRGTVYYRRREYGERDIVKCLAIGFDIELELQNSISSESFISSMTEGLHYGLEHRVLYITDDFASAIIESTNHAQLDHLVLPFRTFEVNFPSGSKFQPHVFCYPDEMMADAALESVERAFDILKIPRGSPMTSEARKTFLERIHCIKNVGPQSVFHHIGIPKSKLDSNATLDDIILEATGASEAESKDSLKLSLGILSYLNTAHVDMKEFKSKNRASIGVKAREIALGMSYKKPVGWHMRKGHFVNLRAERYRRADDGSARVIWRRPSEINPSEKMAAQKKDETQAIFETP